MTHLVSWVGSDGTPGYCMVDFNQDQGGSSFKTEYRHEIYKMGLMPMYNLWVKAELGGKDTNPGFVKSGTRPLMKLGMNNYGEPLLPDPSKGPSQSWKWNQDVILAFVTKHYHVALGLSPETVMMRSYSVPWLVLKSAVRQCLSLDSWPDKFLDCLVQPSRLTVQRSRKLLNYWYKRQVQLEDSGSDSPVFKFFAVPDGEHGWIPRKPRSLLGGDSGMEEAIVAPRAHKRKNKVKGKAKQRFPSTPPVLPLILTNRVASSETLVQDRFLWPYRRGNHSWPSVDGQELSQPTLPQPHFCFKSTWVPFSGLVGPATGFIGPSDIVGPGSSIGPASIVSPTQPIGPPNVVGPAAGFIGLGSLGPAHGASSTSIIGPVTVRPASTVGPGTLWPAAGSIPILPSIGASAFGPPTSTIPTILAQTNPIELIQSITADASFWKNLDLQLHKLTEQALIQQLQNSIAGWEELSQKVKTEESFVKTKKRK
ncbi:hypothetical protein FA15DRAFT_710348 [Coprinopsis marcescibilis]|uniref:Uncharacterized protein n=1 Tax=Coprinopsis marcescibilis TaxID=230819 RepID=A0A5C3KD94_COPMA|nr:hypothetical protein FA15DRAFT_710348 [Coprinopsis marcescibilis]